MSFTVSVGPLSITASTLAELSDAILDVRTNGVLSACKALAAEYESTPAATAESVAEEILGASEGTGLFEANFDAEEWNRLARERQQKTLDQEAEKIKREGKYKIDPRYDGGHPVTETPKPVTKGLSV